MSLTVRAEREGTILRVVLSGELDAHTAAVVGAAVDPELEQAGLSGVVVDSGELSFMDSAGISELLRIQRVLADRGASIRVENAGPTVRRVLEITGLLEILDVQ